MLIIINTRSIICMSSPVWPAIFINRCHIRPVTGSVLHLSEPDISLLSVYKILRPVVFIFLLDRIVIRSSIFRCDTKCHSVCDSFCICQHFIIFLIGFYIKMCTQHFYLRLMRSGNDKSLFGILGNFKIGFSLQGYVSCISVEM